MAEEEQQAIEEIKNKETLNQYIERYINELENGQRLTSKHTIYTKGTIKSIKNDMAQFREFQNKKKKEFDFEDIDLDFYKT